MGTSATRAKNKYNDKAYDRINFTLPKGEKEIYRTHAEKHGESVNAFIHRAISAQMERDNAPGTEKAPTP